MFKLNDLIIICIVIYGLFCINNNYNKDIKEVDVNKLIAFKNNNDENIMAEVNDFENNQKITDYDIKYIVDQKKDFINNEDILETEYDTSLPIDLPRPGTLPEQPITSKRLEQFNGKTIKEVYNSLIPDYSQHLDVLEGSNISGNVSMIAENNKIEHFDTTYSDSTIDFNYLQKNFTQF
jgi:hypothetical protein